MVHFVNPHFRKESGKPKATMTVSENAGKERSKKTGKGGSGGAFRFKMSTVKEVMRRKNQMGILVKKRLLESLKKEESRLEEEFQMQKLDKELKEIKKEIKRRIKRSKEEAGDVPIVKIRLEIRNPKNNESMLLREKDVNAGRLAQLGVPGAVSVEKAVQAVQHQLDGVRKQQTEMLTEVEKLLKSLQAEDEQ